MPTSLPPEIFWLTLTTIMTGLLWLPYIANQIIVMGLWTALSNSYPQGVRRSPWAQRAAAAHANGVENLVVFAPLVLTVHVLGLSSASTASACAGYFAVRAAHYVAYLLGIPLLRTLLFAGGVVCQLILAAAVFGI